jgi:hypothetical protein
MQWTRLESCSMDDWLILYCFKSHSRIFHSYGGVTIAGEGQQNLGLCSALYVFGRTDLYCGTLAVTYGTPILRSHLNDRPMKLPYTICKGMLTHPRQLILPLVTSKARVSMIFTMNYSMYLMWTLVLTADFFALHEWNILTANYSVHLICTQWFWLPIFMVHGSCDRSADDAYSS